MRILFLLALVPLFAQSQRTAHMIDGPRGKVGFSQFLPPDYKPKGAHKSPLIIFLHGIGEKGTGSPKDLQKLDCCGLPRYINIGHTMQFTWNGKTEGFVVLYPQLYSRYGTWENYYVDLMFDYAKKNLNIDTNRIFLTGLSLGGGGTWVYAASSLKNAKQFAGIAPVVSPCFMGNGCNIAKANLPIYAVHALDDDRASYTCTTEAIASIINCGTQVVPSIVMYEKGGHYVWTKAAYDTAYNYYNPNMFEWMLAQNRLYKPNVKPVARAGEDVVISSAFGTAVLDGSKSSDADGEIVRYVWRKIQGPSYGKMSGDVTAKPVVSGLTYPGIYSFQLRAIDNRAEWSTDTVRVTVVDGNVLNK